MWGIVATHRVGEDLGPACREASEPGPYVTCRLAAGELECTIGH